MGQTGITTAVGLCIEESWRTVPVTVDTGAATIGKTSAPHRFMIVEPGGGFKPTPNIIVPDDEIDGDIQLKRTILTARDYAGGFGFKADPEVLHNLLLSLLGKDVQTTAHASTTTQPGNVYKHVFTPNIYAPSMTCEEIFGDGTSGRLSSGIILDELDLTFGDVISGRFNGIPFRQIPNNYPDSGVDTDFDFTSTAALYPTQMGRASTNTLVATVPGSRNYVDVTATNGNGPFVWAGMKYGSESGHSANFLLVDGAAISGGVDLLPGFNIAMRRNIETHQTGGSGYDKGAVTGNQISVTGSGLTVLYKNNNMVLPILKKTRFALNFAFDGVLIGSTGTKYSMEVHVPRMRFLDVDTDVPAGAMMVGGGFVAEKDPSLGYTIKVTLWNTFTNAALGGGVGTTPGGLGGWSSS